jgi:GTP cyclohydrolase I
MPTDNNFIDFRKAAEEIADTLVSASGGPITNREFGISYVETFLRELAHRQGKKPTTDNTEETLSGVYQFNTPLPWHASQLLMAVRKLVMRTGHNMNDPHIGDTPARYLEAWDFWTRGYTEDPANVIRTFEMDTVQYDTMVFQASVPLWSLCIHHLAPFWGLAHVGYIPNGKVVGLSKLARLVDVFARRLQTQEQLGCQVVDSLMEHLGCTGAGVVLQCRHACLESRGVQKAGTLTITSALRGVMRSEPDCRAEFMSLIGVAVQGVRGV